MSLVGVGANGGRWRWLLRWVWPALASAGLLAAVLVVAVAPSTAQTVTPMISTYAGGDAPGPVSATAAGMYPNAVASRDGDIYVADANNNVVREITSSGTEQVVAGNGTSGYSGDGGPATDAALSYPSGVTSDSAGNLLITDYYNDRVRMVAAADCASSCAYGLSSTSAGDIYTVAGDGTGGDSGDGGPATSAELDEPVGVAVDPAGDIIVADSINNQVRMVASSSCSSSCVYGLSSTKAGDIYTIAGDGTAGYSGDGGEGVSAELDFPYGVAVDSAGDVLIADADNQRVRMVASSSCASSCAYGLSTTTAGDIYTIAGDGTGGFSGDDGPSTSAELDFPYGVVVDSTGDVLIADFYNNRVRMLAADTCASSCPYGLPSTTSGDIYTIVGDGVAGYDGDGGPAVSAELDSLYGVAVDSAGDLLIADSGNDRVRMVASSSCASSCAYGLSSTTAGDIYTIAGNGTLRYSGDGGPATSAELDSLYGVAVDSAGDLLIADSGNDRVRMVASSSCASSCAYGLSSTTAGNIYTIAGDGVAGYSGDGGPAISASIEGPSGVAVDSTGNIFMSNYDRVRMVAAANCSSSCPYGLGSTTEGYIYTIAGDGTAGYSGDGGPGIAAELDGLGGVAVDSAGDVILSDGANNRVRMVAASDCSSSCPYGLSSTTEGYIYTIAGNGTGGYSGDGGMGTAGELDGNQGVAVDSSGNVLIADSGNEAVRMVAASSCASACAYGFGSTTAGYIYTIAGTGTSGYTGDGGPATSAQLNYFYGVGLDSAGDVLIADTWNNVVRMVASSSCASSCPYGLASTTAGDIYTIAGNGNYGYSGDGGPAASSELAEPYGVTGESGGDLLIADTGNDLVREVTDTGVSTTSTTSTTSSTSSTSSTSTTVVPSTTSTTVSSGGGGGGGSSSSTTSTSTTTTTTSTSVPSSTTTSVPSSTTTTVAPVPVGETSESSTGPGGVVGVGVSGLSPGETVTVYVHSQPVELGTMTANGAGVAEGSFTIPGSLPAGTHTLEVVAPDGQVIYSRTITVAAPSCDATVSSPGVVGMAETPDGAGYWIASSTGQVVACGDAPRLGDGSAGTAAIASAPSGDGYWLVTKSGQVTAFGSAANHGEIAPGTHLNGSIVAMAVDPKTGGYWLLGSDGGVFSYDAPFYGSTGNLHLVKPAVGMEPTPDGKGYRFVASDGGVFDFGDAAFHGSTGGVSLDAPVVGIADDPVTGGYWLDASDGGIFAFDAPFYGSTGNARLAAPCVSMTALPDGKGYRFVAGDGGIFDFGQAVFEGSAAH